MMQSVIQRMAENSRSCKLWCVTLAAAMLVLMSGTDNNLYALFALVPTAFLAWLDIYYLSLEQRFRNGHDHFVARLHEGILAESDLFEILPRGSTATHLLKSVRSTSVWLFYLPLALLVAGIATLWV